MAPEIILRKGHNMAADWWSLGVLLYELLTGKTPFFSENVLEVYRNIVELNIVPLLHFRVRPSKVRNAKHLIKKLLQPDLSKRFGNLKGGSWDIRLHKFYRGFLWETMTNRYLSAPFVPPDGASKENLCLVGVSSVLGGLKQRNTEKDDPFVEW